MSAGRESREQQRERLLPRLHEVIAEHGLAASNLRFLASRTGTSARMLHYYFGSSEGLLAAVVEYERGRQRRALEALVGMARVRAQNAADGLRAIEGALLAYFDHVTAMERRGFLKFYFELLAAAGRDPAGYEVFRGAIVTDWVRYMQHLAKEIAGLEVDDEAVRAVLATARGFYIEVLAGVPVAEAREGFALALRVLLGPLSGQSAAAQR